MGEGAAAEVEGVGHVREARLRVRRQVPGEPVGRGFQGGRGPCREDQHLPGPRRPRGRRLRRLLQDHVGVGAAHAESVDASAPGTVSRLPGHGCGVDEERARGEVDLRVGPLEVQARRNRPVLQREHRFDQAGDPRRGVEMADVGLHRSQGAEAPAADAGAEGLGEGRELDGVAQGGGGAVGLDVADGVGLDLGHDLGGADDLGLPLHAGRRVGHLGGAVVVDGRALDHGVDGVAVGLGVLQPLEDDDPQPVAEHGSRSSRVEGAAVAVRRGHPALGPQIAGALREAQRGAAGERHVALAVEQALGRQVDGDQRGRAGGLHRQARPFEVQLVGDQRRQVVLVGPQQATEEVDAVAVGPDVEQHVGAEAHARIDADRPAVGLGIVTRRLQGLPGTLQEQPVLRVDDLRLARRQAEELGVEQVGPFDHRARLDVTRVGQQLAGDAGGGHLLVAEALDGLHPVAQVVPELADVVRTREASRHSDDRNQTV